MQHPGPKKKECWGREIGRGGPSPNWDPYLDVTSPFPLPGCRNEHTLVSSLFYQFNETPDISKKQALLFLVPENALVVAETYPLTHSASPALSARASRGHTRLYRLTPTESCGLIRPSNVALK